MHLEFLLTALEQANLGRGFCAPNPPVGAVAVQKNTVLAKDWHRGAGTPHAERLIFEKLPAALDDITLYVTLEPCNHWGRTPPCVDAIIKYGVQRVVYAYRDPNPVVQANDTPARLREQGIEVIHFPVPQIDTFYQSYRHWTKTGKPWVTAKIAQSFDGKIAGEYCKRLNLSNDSCALFTHQQRKQTDIILTTASTVNYDNPTLNARLPEGVFSKPIAILDRNLRLNLDANVLKQDKPRHIFYDQEFAAPQNYSNVMFHAVPTDAKGLNLDSIIACLGALGYHDVWVEAGGRLFSALHQAQLVNQTYIYLTPHVVGPSGIPGYHVSDLFKKPHTINWHPMGNNMIVSLLWDKATEESACSPA
ncbi:bifunctional diaminohydroxyphosphoribosylaminopyrimidine deaminase/5-amino-6-(5-phosphoribosylamino)uracil reductase RibD [Legionella yabuuchiae]|uniref:bifunctional diaminohydroxyphosphoribosylaminopyrimidine deaminase/5-amino-6-(5-phosphoribosylamino)uracil reductase RibD n=1 Tax=Legionella yabuuchiae TaxID=376727 RepID=UPI0010548C3E|nr:bifunctional diaminohydroxyphosphoribosylaminopyrimidine deaminase/5-amino-6-(5-phosphoribosylamino)uracil reductase RibD [Legionella yabuuchiae]